MKHLEGKVISIPVTLEQVRKSGVFYLTDNDCIYQNANLGVTANECDVSYLERNLGFVKTLAVRQIQPNSYGCDGQIDSYVELNSDHVYPLNCHQWQQAIENGEVDSGKIVKFEIKKQLDEEEYETVEYAEIVYNKERLYTEQELREAMLFASEHLSSLKSINQYISTTK